MAKIQLTLTKASRRAVRDSTHAAFPGRKEVPEGLRAYCVWYNGVHPLYYDLERLEMQILVTDGEMRMVVFTHDELVELARERLGGKETET